MTVQQTGKEDICLREGERLDDLEYKGLFLIQRPGCAFSADSVLLAGFARLKPSDTAIDLGAGSGVIATLCACRTGASFVCLEREESATDMARRSMAYNGLSIPVYCMDWQDAPALLGRGTFTAAVCNPPYFSPGSTVSPDGLRAAARSGDTLDSLIPAAKALLDNGGRLFLCYPAGQITELMYLLRQNGLEPKRLRPVQSRPDKPPYLVLLEAKKGAKPGLIWEMPLYISDTDGRPTPEIRQIYHRSET